MSLTIHATTVSLNGRGVLLRGQPGSGKSSLALQLIDQPGRGLGAAEICACLIADDQTVLTHQNGTLYASAPEALKGLLELRGLGLLPVATEQDVPLALVVDLVPSASIERLPEPATLHAELMGIALPCIAVDASHPSAAARIRAAFVAVASGKFPP